MIQGLSWHEYLRVFKIANKHSLDETCVWHSTYWRTLALYSLQHDAKPPQPVLGFFLCLHIYLHLCRRNKTKKNSAPKSHKRSDCLCILSHQFRVRAYTTAGTKYVQLLLGEEPEGCSFIGWPTTSHCASDPALLPRSTKPAYYNRDARVYISAILTTFGNICAPLGLMKTWIV